MPLLASVGLCTQYACISRKCQPEVVQALNNTAWEVYIQVLLGGVHKPRLKRLDWPKSVPINDLKTFPIERLNAKPAYEV